MKKLITVALIVASLASCAKEEKKSSKIPFIVNVYVFCVAEGFCIEQYRPIQDRQRKKLIEEYKSAKKGKNEVKRTIGKGN